MNEHITILSKEAITRGLLWPTLVVGVVGILFALSTILYLIIKPKNMYYRICNLFYHAAFCMGLMLITSAICSWWFPVETGRYKYTGTLSEEMSIKEYKEFEETYSNITYKDGVWYWEDKE